MKPYKGRISNWSFHTLPKGRQIVWGIFRDHPQFAGKRGHTSEVILQSGHADGTTEIETLNSRYTLEYIHGHHTAGTEDFWTTS